MSRFTRVNPFNVEHDDPNTVYYNGQLMCKDNSAPLAKFIDAQDVPILKDVGKFSVLLTQLEINNVTKDLPVYTPVLGRQESGNGFFTANTFIMMGADYIDSNWVVRNHYLGKDANLDLTYTTSDDPSIITTANTNLSVVVADFQDSLEQVKIEQEYNSKKVIGYATIVYTYLGFTLVDAFNVYYFNIQNNNFVMCLLINIDYNIVGVRDININFNEYTFFPTNLINIQPFNPYTFHTDDGVDFRGITGTYVPNYIEVYNAIIPTPSANYSSNMEVVGPYNLKIEIRSVGAFFPADVGRKLVITPAFDDGYYLQPLQYSDGSSARALQFVPLTIISFASSIEITLTMPEVGVLGPLIMEKLARVQVFADGVNPLMTFTGPNNYNPGDLLSINTITGSSPATPAANPINLNKIQDLPIITANPTTITVSGYCSVLGNPPIDVFDSRAGELISFEVSSVSFKTTNASALRFSFNSSLAYNLVIQGTNRFIEYISTSFRTTPFYIRTRPYLLISDLVFSFQSAFNEFFKRTNGSLFLKYNNFYSDLNGFSNFPYIQTNNPILNYNPSSALFEFSFDPYGFFNTSTGIIPTSISNPKNNGNTICSSVESIILLANKPFADFFAGFSWTIFDFPTLDESLYVFNILTIDVIPLINPTTGQQQVLTQATAPSPYFINPKNTATLTAKYPNQQNYRVIQEYSYFGSGFSPVDAIVLTTTNIPIQKEYNTKSLQVNETNNLGNNTNKGTFLNILYTLSLPVKNPNDWKTVINLSQIPEHKKNYMMSFNTELKVIDVQFWWKNRLTNELIPLTMPNNSSILFKLRFRKED